MTCVIGMYCNKGKSAVIVSDSREMQGNDFVCKRKIYEIGDKVVYAGSGYSGMSIELRENVENRLKSESITDNSVRIKIIEEEMWRIWAYYKHPEAAKFLMNDILIDAILGTYINGKTKLYCLHENGWAEPTEDKFRATGDGWRFANQILNNLYREDLSVGQAIELGIHCIVQISRLDSVVDDNPQVAILEEGEIKIMNLDESGDFLIAHPALTKTKIQINGIENYRTKVFRLMMSKNEELKNKFKETIEKFKD